jgi:GNAT superfamily N-acetyltransferase
VSGPTEARIFAAPPNVEEYRLRSALRFTFGRTPGQMSDTQVRIARTEEHPRVEAAYAAWGYRGGVGAGDILYIAECGVRLVGAVRRSQEHGTAVLRGMYVAPGEQRRGLGTSLLHTLVADLHGSECFCVPHAYLAQFYAAGGFAPAATTAVPVFLRERAESYRARGLDVLVMRRPPEKRV